MSSQALRYFRRKIGTPLLVVWDRLNAHRSQVTTAFIAAHAQDYAVAYLPAYAPELNPEEQCNALVKRAMANALPGSVDDLHRLARREFGRLKRHPEMIVQLLPACRPLRYRPPVKIIRCMPAFLCRGMERPGLGARADRYQCGTTRARLLPEGSFRYDQERRVSGD